ncbi:MAG: DsrE/DsrF/DrsH-like family protein [Clostridia bacterium]
MKIVIIGGVAGGATAATRLRRLSENNEIIIIERDKYISYANCGLPYYIGGVIKEKENLQVQSVEVMLDRYNVECRVLNEVVAVDRDKKEIEIKKLETNETYKLSYDKLIMSCGAKPIKPKIKGLDKKTDVFTLRNIPDTYKIKDYINNNDVKKAVVIGGGFIGVEMAENLRELGISVSLVEKLPQVLRPIDFEMAQIVHQELANNGVELFLGDGVSEFTEKGILLESGKELSSDLTILSIGVVPENTLALSSNIKVGKRGHIVTNATFNVFDKESDKVIDDIYAIGDMIEVINPLDDSPYAVPLAWGANRQGRLVADSIMGRKIRESKILGTSVLKVFNLTVSSTGSNESTLKMKNIDYEVVHAHRANHASYYPGSSTLSMKLLFDKKNGKIFGAQAVGREGTEKRIDVISTTMRLGGTIYDLQDLELAYAPAYSAAKDPVNILGYIAENIANGVYKVTKPEEIDEIVKNGGLVLDVRSPFEFNNGHIEGAQNIFIDKFRQKLGEIKVEKDTPIYLYCQIGLKAYLVINILRDNGYTNLYNISGGYSTYRAFKYVPKTLVIEDNKTVVEKTIDLSKISELDVCGLQCPGPLMATYKKINTMADGERVNVVATDGGFANDIKSWCETNGHKLVDLSNEKGKINAVVEKGVKAINKGENMTNINQENATIVVFSGELDKVLASMIIAQGAAAQGKKVTMFFTFWGLNALRKPHSPKVKKNFIEKMFGFMMPKGASKLPLSNMNMGGIGAKMIKGIMKKNNVHDLATQMQEAQDIGIKMIACTMSMDLMGIKKEELLDNIEYAGVATYISRNENVGTTLFI